MAGKTNKGRKINRNKKWCEAYVRGGREAINRKRRLRTAIRQQPNNAEMLARYESEFGKYQSDKPLNAKAQRLVNRRLAA